MPLDENGNEIGSEATPPVFDENKIAELIQKEVASSFKSALAEANENRQTQQVPRQTQQSETDPIAEWLNPHIQPHLQRANLASAAALDKADFYGSEEWENLDEILGEDEADLKKEKREIRTLVEKRFEELVKAGVPTPRKTVLELVLGQKMSKDSASFIDKVSKKSAKKKDADLNRARSASDIGAAQVTSMSRDDVYAMDDDAFEKAFADIQF